MIIFSWLTAVWEMLVQSAGWLLVGFFLAGVIHRYLPLSAIEKHLKQRGLKSVLKASALGTPLSLCSCSVIPVAVALRRQGASRGATASFLVSTPEIGVDSFFLSYALLGAPLACVRLVAAFISAVGVGWLIDTFVGDKDEVTSQNKPEPASCCAPPPQPQAKSRRIWPGILHYGFVEMLDDISRVLTIGFLLSGLISVLFPSDLFRTLSLSPVTAMLIMFAVSLPLYVCASSSTPLAAALLAKGLNPGAVIVFLLAGPASNVTTMMVLAREFGKKALILYIAAIGTITFATALLVDRIFGEKIQSGIPVVGHAGMHDHVSIINNILAVIFIALLCASLYRNARRGNAGSGAVI